MAGWHAAWTAALVAVFIFAEIPVPDEIQGNVNGFGKDIGRAVTFPVTNSKNQRHYHLLTRRTEQLVRP